MDDGSGAKGGSESYYMAHKRELAEAFGGVVEGAKQFWEQKFGLERAAKMGQEATALFDRLLPGLPDVGGERNWLAHLIPVAAWYVALYAPMKASGKRPEDVGKLVYDLLGFQLQAVPKEQALAEGAKMFTREGLDKMREWAVWTQKREFPANWVAEFVPGDGKAFDFGYDYSECAILKYLEARSVPELAPYVCACDFPASTANGTGLQRIKALAYGDSICNFRYKRGGPVLQDWSTEAATIKSRMPRRQEKVPGP